MDSNLSRLLLLGGVLGLGYFAFTHYVNSRQRIPLMPLTQTRKIAHEIKHHMLAAAITFAGQVQDKIRAHSQEHSDAQINYFTTKMAEVYSQKEMLILDKYAIAKIQYEAALLQYANDEKLKSMKNEIINIMENSVRGIMPSLEVGKKAANAFSKGQLSKIYSDMNNMVLSALATKLKDLKSQNPTFDSKDDHQFKVAIRNLNVFDRKIDYLKQRGFKEEWGCPNEIFFKLVQTHKMRDPQFRQQMKRLEQIFDQAVDIIAADPIAFSIQTINSQHLEKNMPSSNIKAFSQSVIELRQSHKQEAFGLNRSSRSQPESKENIKQQKQFEDLPDQAERP